MSESFTPEALLRHIEALERLEEKKQDLAVDVKERKDMAKNEGFDIKIIDKLVKLRAMKDADRTEQEELLDTYKRAVGLR